MSQLAEALNGCEFLFTPGEQAPSQWDESYRQTVRALVERGFRFQIQTMTNVGRAHVCRTVADVPDEAFFISYVGYGEPTIADWEHLATLPGLRDIGAGHAAGRIVPGGIRALLPATNLTNLNMGDTSLSAEDLRMLPSFTKLSSVSMVFADDQAVATVAKLPHLGNITMVSASHGHVTDACLKPLESARILENLSIGVGVSISREAAVAFAAARPDVLVKWRDEWIIAPMSLPTFPSLTGPPMRALAPPEKLLAWRGLPLYPGEREANGRQT